MEDVMDAPMDLGASSHQVPQAFHQVSNAQYANANTTGGESWSAAIAHLPTSASWLCQF